MRLTAAGQPDPAFGGGDGVVVDDYGKLAAVRDVAVSPDGSAYVCGLLTVFDASVANHELLLARYTPAGEQDPSFAEGGQVATPAPVLKAPQMVGHHVALTGEGKIMVAGSDETNPLSKLVNQRGRPGAVRYTSRGTLDRSFGGAKAVPADQRVAPLGRGRVVLRRDGTLQVRGTGQRDTIRFGLAPGVGGLSAVGVTVNGKDQTFPLERVKRIVVTGGAGDDVLVVLPTLTLPTRLDGGSGDDVIVGGLGDDILAGGPGADDLLGRRGTNQLFGRDAKSTAGDPGDVLNNDPNEGI